jgi:hypothetical protein
MLRLAYDPEDEYREIFIHYFLEDQRFLRRLWAGIKYIFGFKTKYGHFGEVMIAEREALDLWNFMDDYASKLGEENEETPTDACCSSYNIVCDD